MPIKPGMHVDVCVDRPAKRPAPLGAVVFAVDGGRITLSQTSPELPVSLAGQTVQVSLISLEGGSARRLGFPALICGFVRDYALSSGERVPAVLLDRQAEAVEINLRRDVRVRPTGESGVGLMVYRNRYPIMDLSLMGLSFSQPLGERAWKPEDKLPLRLSLEGKALALRARVVRVTEKARVRIVALAFLEVGPDAEALLWKTIFRIDRENLCRQRPV